jgi:hypothetical protein
MSKNQKVYLVIEYIEEIGATVHVSSTLEKALIVRDQHRYEREFEGALPDDIQVIEWTVDEWDYEKFKPFLPRKEK